MEKCGNDWKCFKHILKCVEMFEMCEICGNELKIKIFKLPASRFKRFEVISMVKQ